MSKRWFISIILFFIALPSVLYAVGMGDMGGMGGMGGMGMGVMVDKIEIHTKNVGDVVFSHSLHGRMFNCGQCHPKFFQQKNNSNHVNMKAMEKGKSCGACHNGKKAFSVTGNCTKCHAGDIVFKVEDPGNVIFSHAFHIEQFGCGECHPDLFKAKHGANPATMEDMENGQACGACHDGSTAFSVSDDCEACHKM